MACPRTSTGSPPRPRPAAEGAPRWACIAAIALACAAPLAHGDARLLPAEEAFRFGARAIDARTVEVRFLVADGYYLYRDKLRFSASPALGARPPALPAGAVKDDPFFGRVETYRGDVLARLTLPQGQPGARVTIEAESQGCADAGVCYPVNRQRVVVALPAAGSPDAPFVDANPARKSWFK